MLKNLEGWHIIIIAIVFIALFGYKKLPDAARSIGRSMRIFKAETAGLRGGEDKAEPPTGPVAPATPVAPAQPVADRYPADSPGA